ncbi:MAG: hypothetical protein ACOCQS_02715 [Bacillota bacterium]
MDQKLENILTNTYFIGGSPCSGKSTITEILADKYNLTYYKIDDYEREHLARANSDRHPVMYKYSQMEWNEIWMRPVDFQVEEEFEFYRERMEMILQDLKQFSKEENIITEGAALLPELLDNLNINKNRVIYMIPSREFQVKHFSQREFIKGILSECEKPEKAFANWMERDHQFGRKVKKQAEKLGYKVIKIDGSNTTEENLKTVSDYFGFKR